MEAPEAFGFDDMESAQSGCTEHEVAKGLEEDGVFLYLRVSRFERK